MQQEMCIRDSLTIGFCGDLKFGRTVHSLIKAMSRYEGIRVVLIAPDELRLPEYMPVSYTHLDVYKRQK